MLYFQTFYSSKNSERKYFSIDNNQKYFLSRFLKDHVTLKTGVMITEIIYILQYITIENSYSVVDRFRDLMITSSVI